MVVPKISADTVSRGTLSALQDYDQFLTASVLRMMRLLEASCIAPPAGHGRVQLPWSRVSGRPSGWCQFRASRSTARESMKEYHPWFLHLIDDVDSNETVYFTAEGIKYVINVSAGHAAGLRSALSIIRGSQPRRRGMN